MLNKGWWSSNVVEEAPSSKFQEDEKMEAVVPALRP